MPAYLIKKRSSRTVDTRCNFEIPPPPPPPYKTPNYKVFWFKFFSVEYRALEFLTI